MARETDLTTEQLEAELARRKADAPAPPTPLANPDFTALTKMIVDGTTRATADGRERKDFEHYVYEAAMEAVYGKSFWKWRNNQKW